jgi:myo-inositol-1(or 4)-monophosphatase
MSSELEPYLVEATLAAQAAGAVIMDMLETAEIREKGVNDLVTDADEASQRIIEEHLRAAFPSHDFLGEEDARSSRDVSGEWLWIVDPIDGTANYAHKLPNFAISIALARNEQVVVGVVFDPFSKELFSAVLGSGARLNNAVIRCSQCDRIDRALVAASFPPQIERGSVEIAQFIEMLMACQGVRRLGSAALNLCFVACGRLDGYWASSVKSWDVAAGQLIATEAGATLSSWKGEPFDLAEGSVCIAASQVLHTQISNCLNACFEAID